MIGSYRGTVTFRPATTRACPGGAMIRSYKLPRGTLCAFRSGGSGFAGGLPVAANHRLTDKGSAVAFTVRDRREPSVFMTMRPRHCALCMFLGLGLAAAASAVLAGERPSKATEEKAERAKFVGLWKGFTVEGKGENPDRGPVRLEITVTEKTMHGIQIKEDGDIDHGVGEYTLDLAADPAWLDAAKTNARGRKQAYTGIYKLEGDTLKWCVSPQKVRPETFETKKGQFLVILKRDKTKP
jgi:uncharacterized protein (TIGR03067 family)